MVLFDYIWWICMANVVGRYTIHGFYKTAAKFDLFSSSFAMLIGTDITIITLPETNIADELPLKMVCWKTEDQPFLFVFRLGDLLVLGRVSTIIQKKNPTIPLYAIPRRPLSVPDDWGIPNHELLALLCPKNPITFWGWEWNRKFSPLRPYLEKINPVGLIFFRWVETTN